MDCPDAGAGKHCDGGFGNGRQIDDDAIALADVVSLQNVGEPADLAVQLLIGKGALLTGFTFPDDGRFVPAMRAQMSIKTVFGEIEFTADKPFRERRLPLEHAPPPFAPKKLARFPRPEFVRPLDRFAIHPPVLFETFDPRFFCKLLRWFEDALLFQERLDVGVHWAVANRLKPIAGQAGQQVNRNS